MVWWKWLILIFFVLAVLIFMSTLISSEGTVNNVMTYDDNNFQKTVFEAFVFTRAKGKTTYTISYKTPIKLQDGDEYKLLIQKQPGTDGWEYKVNLFGDEQKPFNLIQDRILTKKI